MLGRNWGGGAGNSRRLAKARSAELRGELALAAALFAEAGRLDEAARVMMVRGDAETDPSARLRHYVQAIATAPAGSPEHTLARRRRADLVLAMAEEPLAQAPSATRKVDLALAAHDLEEAGEYTRAAEAYARAGDAEGEARALARAGDVDRLDALLAAQQYRDREVLARRRAHEEFTLFVASGRRREALALATGCTDEALCERGRVLAARRVAGDTARLVLGGHELSLALGEEIVIGRAGTIAVAAAALSRRHVALARRGDDVFARDLGSSNGTTLRGLALAGEVRVGEGLELRLGNEVPLVVRPAQELRGAMAIEIAGARYVAPLGTAPLGIGSWRLERTDGWLELVTEDAPPAFAGALRLTERIGLLAGDALAPARHAAPWLEVR